MKQKTGILKTAAAFALCIIILVSFVQASYAGSDVTPPAVTELSPPNGIHYVIPDVHPSIRFNEPVHAVGKGRYIRINGSTLVNIDPMDTTKVTLSEGDTLVTINPGLLEKNHEYSIDVDAGAFEDGSENPCASINGATQWHFDTNQIWVHFNSNGGSSVASVLVDCKYTVPEPAPPTKAGYRFRGWYKDIGLTSPWDFVNDIVVDDPTTLYAKWTIDAMLKIKITINNKRWGSASGAGTYPAGDFVRIKAIPKPGCRFVRWMEGRKLFSTSSVYSFEINGSCTLKAEFAKIGTPVITSAKAAASGSISLKYKKVEGVNGYDIYRCNTKFGKYEKIGSTDALTLSYTDTGLQAGKSYYYKIKAFCVADQTTTYSSFSNRKTAVAK